MNSEQCEAFMRACTNGSIAKAAQGLYVSPQSVSQQIARLEKEIGTPLLARSSSGVTPTPAGRLFLEWCQQTSASAASVISACRLLGESDRSVIRLGLSREHTLSLYKHIAGAYLKKEKALALEYTSLPTAQSVDHLLDALHDETVDVLEWIDPHDNELGFLPLIRRRRCCLLSARNPLSRKDVIKARDLTDQRVYVYSLLWTKNLQEWIERQGLDIKLVEVGAPDAPSLLRSYLNDNAIYLLPEQLAPLYENLISVPLDIDVYTEYGLAYLKRNEDFLQEFLDCAKTVFEA